MVAITQTLINPESVTLHWDNKHQSELHNIWLRDNCRCAECYHAVAEERILDSSMVPLDITPKSVTINAAAQALEIEWATADAHASSYPFAFLAQYAQFPNQVPPMRSERIWSVADMERELPTLPRTTYEAIMGSEAGVLAWLELLNKYGFVIISGVPQGHARVQEVGRRIAVIRNSFWGEDPWAVKDLPDPTSLSLTGGDLFPHTDLCFSNEQPGVQFLHCREFSADKMVGGESTIVDGYQVAEKIRREHPEAFAVLTSKPIRHVFSSKKNYYEFTGNVIKCDTAGAIQELRFNQALIAPHEVPASELKALHSAVQLFGRETRDAANLLNFRLKEGEMLVFNNHRMLHGRRGYDAVNTRRHLEGCYLDYEEFQSRLMKLREAAQ